MSAHAVGRQTLEVEVDSEDLALTLHARLAELNRRHVLPALEEVFDEFDRPGRHLRCDALTLDLGRLPPAELDRELGPRLRAALRDALRRALREDGPRDEPRAVSLDAESARRELLEHYLVHGTLPFWAPREPPFTCEASVLDLARTDAAGLAALLRRRWHTPRVFERLAAQLREPALRRLVGVLEPRHAGVVVAYLASLRAAQSAERLLPVSEPGFSRLIWCLAQAYLARDPGSQFNRRSFLGALVRGLAAREGFEYAELLHTLQRALAHSRRRLARHASFPSVVAELVHEAEQAGAAGVREPRADETDDPPSLDELRRAAGPYADVQRLRAWLATGSLPWRDVLRGRATLAPRGLEALPDLPVGLLRELLGGSPAERRRRLVRAAGALPDARLHTLLRRLLPQLRREHSPLAEALASFAGQARERRAFYAAALAAALDGGDLDLESWAAAELPRDDVAPERPEATWDGPTLLLALSERLESGAAGARDATLAEWLEALTTRHAPHARAFVLALRRSPRARTALLRAVPAAGLLALLAAALPADARPLIALGLALERLPGPRRPRAEDAWRALCEATARGDAGAPTPAFYARVLREVFGGAPSAATREALRHALENGSSLPATDLTALRAALQATHAVPVTATPGAASRAAEVTPEADDPLPLEAQVSAWLSATQPPPSESDDTLADALDEWLDQAPRRLLPVVRREVAERPRREHWAAHLPDDVLARLVALLEPRRHARLIASMEILASAWSEVAPPGHPALFGRHALWAFLLEFLAETPAAERSLERLTLAFCAHFAARYAAVTPGAAGGEEVGARLLTRAGQLARGAGAGSLVAVLEHERGRLLECFAGRLLPSRPPRLARPRPVSPLPPPRSRPGAGRRDDEATTGQPIYVANAGLVLVGAYLPRFFQALDLLGRDDDGREALRDDEALARGVHLLQCLVDGSSDTPEAQLALNKVLCGATPVEPVARGIVPTAAELEAVERLLRSVLGNWTVLGGTSVAGLRETFLQREGRLEATDEGWQLTVQRKTLDVLVDQLPWSFSVLLHGFMRRPLYTRW